MVALLSKRLLSKLFKNLTEPKLINVCLWPFQKWRKHMMWMAIYDLGDQTAIVYPYKNTSTAIIQVCPLFQALMLKINKVALMVWETDHLLLGSRQPCVDSPCVATWFDCVEARLSTRSWNLTAVLLKTGLTHTLITLSHGRWNKPPV